MLALPYSAGRYCAFKPSACVCVSRLSLSIVSLSAHISVDHATDKCRGVVYTDERTISVGVVYTHEVYTHERSYQITYQISVDHATLARLHACPAYPCFLAQVDWLCQLDGLCHACHGASCILYTLAYSIALHTLYRLSRCILYSLAYSIACAHAPALVGIDVDHGVDGCEGEKGVKERCRHEMHGHVIVRCGLEMHRHDMRCT